MRKCARIALAALLALSALLAVPGGAQAQDDDPCYPPVPDPPEECQEPAPPPPAPPAPPPAPPAPPGAPPAAEVEQETDDEATDCEEILAQAEEDPAVEVPPECQEADVAAQADGPDADVLAESGFATDVLLPVTALLLLGGLGFLVLERRRA